MVGTIILWNTVYLERAIGGASPTRAASRRKLTQAYGGYVRGRHKEGHFEVIAGESSLAFKKREGKPELSGRCFAWVQTYDEKPKRRLFELLKSEGMQPNQQVDFLSDGGEDVRNVQLYFNPQAEHLLDWFHLTMRLTKLQTRLPRDCRRASVKGKINTSCARA